MRYPTFDGAVTVRGRLQETNTSSHEVRGSRTRRDWTANAAKLLYALCKPLSMPRKICEWPSPCGNPDWGWESGSGIMGERRPFHNPPDGPRAEGMPVDPVDETPAPLIKSNELSTALTTTVLASTTTSCGPCGDLSVAGQPVSAHQ